MVLKLSVVQPGTFHDQFRADLVHCEKLEIYPQRPRYFAPASHRPYTAVSRGGVEHQWGVAYIPGGLTLVITWLMAGGGGGIHGGGKQRSCCSQNHWSSNTTTSRLFQRQRSKNSYVPRFLVFVSLGLCRGCLCGGWSFPMVARMLTH